MIPQPARLDYHALRRSIPVAFASCDLGPEALEGKKRRLSACADYPAGDQRRFRRCFLTPDPATNVFTTRRTFA